MSSRPAVTPAHVIPANAHVIPANAHVIPASAGISGAASHRIEIPGQARDDERGRAPKEVDR